MVLMLRRDEVEPLLDLPQAIDVTKAVAQEDAAGTVVRMPPFGGNGWSRRIVRVVGGGLFGLGRFGIRAGELALVFDADTSEALAIMDLPTGDLRLAASVATAAQYLAREDAHRLALIGSGTVAHAMLRGLCAVRPIDDVRVYSRSPEHRRAFAESASAEFGISVAPADAAEAAVRDADVVAAGTNAREPLVRYEWLRPGTHVSSAGLNFELDRSVYERADQFVAASPQQEIASAAPTDTPGRVTGGPISELLRDGTLSPAAIVALGTIVRGDVAPRSGPNDINVFRESRGGLGDAALAARAYDLARQRGLGTEFALR